MKVSIIKIIKSDYVSMILLLIPIVMVVLYIDTEYFGVLGKFLSRRRHGSGTEGDSAIFMILTIISVVAVIPAFIYRVKSFMNHFMNGFEVKGIITAINFRRDKGKVEYEYQIDGEVYKSGHNLMKNKFTKTLAEGQEVNLVVARNNNEKAFIKEMYLA